MEIVDGKKLAQKVTQQLKQELAGTDLGLAAVFVGHDPALKKFVDLKKRVAQEVGIQFSVYEIDEEEAREQVPETLQWLSHDEEVHGILVELPLPSGLDTQKMLDLIPIGKDVDVLTSEKEKEFYANISSILPPAVGALQLLSEEYKIEPKGMSVAVFGQGRLVGAPVSHWLESQGSTVQRIDEHTKNPEQYSRKADMVISGVGKPGLITEDMVKDDAIVIDFGYGRKGKKMMGDVDFENVSQKASLITPVPGGMGPLVTVAVLKNLLYLYQKTSARSGDRA